MLKKTSLFGVGLILAGILAAAQGFAVLFPREPEYHGRPLHAWVDQLCSGTGGSQAGAVDAFRHMGPDALTPLVHMIGARDPAWMTNLVSVVQRHSKIDFHLVPARQQKDRAIRGFYALGPAANAAVPGLADLLNDREARLDAATALAAIGREGIAPLVEVLADEDPEIRTRIVWLLGTLGSNATTAVPALVAMLRDDDEGVRTATAAVLGMIGRKPALVVPALTKGLSDPNPWVRRTIVFELRVFGKNDVTVVPTLIRYLKDEDGGVRQSAADSLGRIGDCAAQAVPALKECLDDPAPWVHQSVVKALKRLGRPMPALPGEFGRSEKAGLQFVIAKDEQEHID